MSKHQKSWTKEEIELAKKCYAAGDKTSSIGAHLGRSKESVAKKMSAIGFCPFRGKSKVRGRTEFPHIRMKSIEWRDVMSASEIGKILGVSRDTVIGHWNRAKANGLIK